MPASPCTRTASTRPPPILLKQLEGFDANDNDSKAIVLHALSMRQTRRLRRLQPPLPRPQLARHRHPRLSDPRVLQHRPQGDRRSNSPASSKARPRPSRTNPSSGNPATRSAWLNDTPETTALVLLALAESKPDSPRAEAAAQVAAAIPRLLRFPHRPRPRPGRGRAGRMVRPRQGTGDRSWKSPCRSTARKSAS